MWSEWGSGGGLRFDILFVLAGKMEDIHCPLLPKDPQCNSSPSVVTRGVCSRSHMVRWIASIYQTTATKDDPPFLFPLFWAFTRRLVCYDTNKARLNMLAFLFGSKRDKWKVVCARCGSAEHKSAHQSTYGPTSPPTGWFNARFKSHAMTS